MKFCALAMFGLTVALHAGPDTQAHLADQAEQLLRSGNQKAALEAMEKAASEPGTAASEDHLGFLFAVAQQKESALAHLRKAITSDPKFAPAHYHLGALLWLAKDQAAALPELETAARLEPRNFDFRYRLGAAYLEQGENNKAAAELKTAVALPANGGAPASRAEAWRQLGLVQQRLNDLASAVKAYAQSLELNPGDDVARNSYAALLIETRQPERGIEEARSILAHNKADTSAQMNIGYAYLKMGDFAKAEQAYRDVIAIEADSAAAHYDLAIALKMQDQIEAAQKEFQRSIALNPDLAEAHYTLGITDWQLGDFPATIEQMKAALAIRPDYAEAHYMLGITLKQSGDLDGALAQLKEAIRLDPSTPGPFNTIGQILRIKGDKQGSEEAFATGAKLKRDKEGQLANTLEQGMRGGAMPKPMNAK